MHWLRLPSYFLRFVALRAEWGRSVGAAGHHLLTSMSSRESDGDNRRKTEKRLRGVPGGRQGLSRLGCINPEFDSQSAALGLLALTHALRAHISPHMHLKPSHLYLCLFQIHLICVLVFVHCHSCSNTCTNLAEDACN